MMMNAYDSIYLDSAMENLGDAFDYAVNVCNISLSDFCSYFIACGLARQYGEGNPRFVMGFSGSELVQYAVENVGLKMDFPRLDAPFDKSAEYWTGWILAYIQWKTGMPFEEILSYFSVNDLRNLYPTLHEAPEDKAVDVFISIYNSRKEPTKLYKYRKIRHYSQVQLAKKSGVNLRSIQMYEQRRKNLNKAAFESVYALSRALGVTMEDLMEYEVA